MAERTAARLVQDGAAMLNAASDDDGFRSAMASFSAALAIDPASDAAAYGVAQARKALEFALEASASSGNQGGSPARGDGDGELCGGVTYRVVHEAKVRRGVERTSEMIRVLPPGHRVEVLAMEPDSTGLLRIRFAEGWVSVAASNSAGTLLLEEDFSCDTGAQLQVVCSGEKLVFQAAAGLRGPSGWVHEVGVAAVTTKRLLWYAEPAAGDRPPGSGGPRVAFAIPLHRVEIGLGRIVALYYRSSALYHVH